MEVESDKEVGEELVKTVSIANVMKICEQMEDLCI
jgi:hypothetical protein